jgi:branched-chain amino acid transport system permease protein
MIRASIPADRIPPGKEGGCSLVEVPGAAVIEGGRRVTEIFGVADPGALRDSADRADQRLVLRNAVARLAVIFGLLNIINFTHGAQYMMGAFCAWFLLNKLGMGYWWSLALAPLAGRRVRHADRAHDAEAALQARSPVRAAADVRAGADPAGPVPAGVRYFRTAVRDAVAALGGQNLGFMFLPNYRAWVIVASLVTCLATWFVIEKTKLGAYLRAATENPTLVQAFGINVPRMITLTYGFGVALAGLAGVMAAPIYQVNPLMGADLIIVVFAVVVIGGMGSILGAIVTGFGLGVIEGLTKVFYPEASNTVIFIVMAIVLIIKPAGLFGTQK